MRSTRWIAVIFLAVSSGCTETTRTAADAGLDAEVADDAAVDAPATPTGPCGLDPPTTTDRVLTDRGVVRGEIDWGVASFRGIPFAAPPIGRGRFAPPADIECAADEIDARSWPPTCTQADQQGGTIGQEDCLYLNVWTPEDHGDALPVIVFFHGGSNQHGSTSDEILGTPIYDGAELAGRAGVVVVTAQYRVGTMGWLAHPALAESDPRGVTGNFGLLDQIAALRWVARNVAAFGGDPTHVLLSGQSAGAFDACVLATSPEATGLFSSVLMMSGGCVSFEREQAYATGRAIAEGVGCTEDGDVASCLRAASAEDLALAAVPPGSAVPSPNPYIDGRTVPDAPMTLLAADESDVPFVIGTTSHEFAAMIYQYGYATEPIATEEEARAILERLYGSASADWILARYPPSDYGSPHEALVAFWSDVYFICPSRTAARAASRHHRVYRYQFTHTFEGGPLAPYGASHGFDWLFLSGNLGVGGYDPSDDERALSDSWMDAMAAFAASGTPSLPAGAPSWEPYDRESDEHLVLDVSLALDSGLRREQCDALDALSQR